MAATKHHKNPGKYVDQLLESNASVEMCLICLLLLFNHIVMVLWYSFHSALNFCLSWFVICQLNGLQTQIVVVCVSRKISIWIGNLSEGDMSFAFVCGHQQIHWRHKWVLKFGGKVVAPLLELKYPCFWHSKWCPLFLWHSWNWGHTRLAPLLLRSSRFWTEFYTNFFWVCILPR